MEAHQAYNGQLPLRNGPRHQFTANKLRGCKYPMFEVSGPKKPSRVWLFGEAESLNIGYVDPLGKVPASARFGGMLPRQSCVSMERPEPV